MEQTLEELIMNLENKLLKDKLDRLSHELQATRSERDIALSESKRFKEALDRILSVSRVALRDSDPFRTGEVRPSE